MVVGQLRSHDAQFAQLVTMFNDLMRRFEEREDDEPGGSRAMRAETGPDGGHGPS